MTAYLKYMYQIPMTRYEWINRVIVLHMVYMIDIYLPYSSLSYVSGDIQAMNHIIIYIFYSHNDLHTIKTRILWYNDSVRQQKLYIWNKTYLI